MTFQTVEQLQAEIATLTTENERLTNENWRFQMGEAVMLKPHLGLISRLTAENERLRGALINIQIEYKREGSRFPHLRRVAATNCRAVLQPKEGGDD